MPESQSWTWMRDLDTGHCFDVHTVRLEEAGGRLRGMQKVGSKPPHHGPTPRRPKHRTDLAGQPSTPPSADAPASGDYAAPAADDEN